MSLRPIHRWKLDDNGDPKLDRHGNQIPHPKIGQPKKVSEYTTEETKDIDGQIQLNIHGKKFRARQILDKIKWAEDILAEDSANAA